MICILCQTNRADTREHRVRASAYRRLLKSDGSYHIIDGDNNSKKLIQGAKSGFLKFKKPDLCADCNNKKSSFADRAFDNLDVWIQDKANGILTNFISNTESKLRYIKLTADDKQTESYIGTICYFSKFLICKINDAGFVIPDMLRDIFFMRANFTENVEFEISVEKISEFEFIEVGPLMAKVQPGETGEVLKSRVSSEYEIFLRHGEVKYNFRVFTQKHRDIGIR